MAEPVTPASAPPDFPPVSSPPPPLPPADPPPAVSGALVSVPAWALRWGGVLMGVMLVLAGGAAVMAWQTHGALQSLEQELVRRQQASAEQAAEARVLAKQAQDVVGDTAAKVALLDSRLSEVALQRTQLEELIQSLSRSRDENLVTDIDASLRVALQQSAITGSAEPLVAALRSADERLGRISQPRLERVHRAIARDLDRVRSVGVPDIGSLLIKLDEAVRLVDELPLLSNAQASRTATAARPAVAGASAAGSSAAASAVAGSQGMFAAWWAGHRASVSESASGVWAELRQLLRVRRIDEPEAMLLAPEQALFLRENVKLRVLNARLSLLSRQAEAAQGDLQLAMSAVQRYFDLDARKTQVALELLRQTAMQSRQVGIPRPDETLAAIAAVVAGR